jgi:hypothetical protein
MSAASDQKYFQKLNVNLVGQPIQRILMMATHVVGYQTHLPITWVAKSGIQGGLKN